MRFAGAVAAVTVVVAAAVLPATGRASAAAGSCGHGVTVVVEHNELGGRDLHACRPAGGTAARLLDQSGLSLTYVQRQPGFVCRLSGVPASDPCVNTPPDDAYWSLWWSDGTSGRWTYATTGVDGLDVPTGGAVAMVWDGRAGDVRPTTPPGGGGSPARDDAASTSGTTPARVRHDDGSLPRWVAPVAVGALFAGAAATAVVRRRRGSHAP